MAKQRPAQRKGRLHVPLSFEDALKAATETKPPAKPKKKRSAKKT
jgi:hypothetical protein